MADFTMPFPDKNLAKRELEMDPCYGKIPAEDRDRIAEQAWKKGEQAANDLFKTQGGKDFLSITRESGLTVKKRDRDFVAGGQRYFSDYISGRKLINLYMKSVDMWARKNHLTESRAVDMILSHEYFHFLECTSIGLTSREYQVPMIIAGRFRIGHTGIRALSEIGAHAFTRTWYLLSGPEEEKHEET
jgi:hypothetical protein